MNELQQPEESSNSCLDPGILVSLRDGELTPDETEQALAHLAQCQDCAADNRSLRIGSQETYDVLAALGPSSDEVPEATPALVALRSRLLLEYQHEQSPSATSPSSASTVRRLSARKGAPRRRWWAAAAAAVLIAVLLLPHADALANQFLGLFQPKAFQPVSVNLDSFRNGIGEDLQSFGVVTISDDSLGSITHPTQAQLEQDLGFQLLLPTYLPPGVGQARQFSLVDSGNATFTFDASMARAYLARSGQGSVSIPPELAGATFTITVAPGVIINYGKQCQAQSQNLSSGVPSVSIPGRSTQSSSAASPVASAPSQNGTGSIPGAADLGCSGGTPFYVGEIPSPVIQATGKASLEDLRSFLLSLPKLAPSVRVLLQDVNLTTGVVPLPIPAQLQAQSVTTHGVSGVLIVDSSLSLGAVLWQTGGIVYVVAGATSSGTQLMDSANSLN